MNEEYDLIIVGGGPGGLTAAIYAGRAELKTLIIEKGSFGGRITETAEVKNYPGTILDSGINIMAKFEKHAKSYPKNDFKRTTVTEIIHEGEGFLVRTKRKGDFRSSIVILDTGTVPKVLGISGEEEFVGKGVSYCATCDADFYKDKEIHVLGAGDEAIEESDYLTKFASKVSIIVRHEEGHLNCNSVAKSIIMKNPRVRFIWDSTLESINGTDKVESVSIKNIKTGEITDESTSGIFFYVGMTPKTEIVKKLVELDSKGQILVNEKQETSVPGIYAIGDCTNTFVRQVITAAADGAKAVIAGEKFLREKNEK